MKASCQYIFVMIIILEALFVGVKVIREGEGVVGSGVGRSLGSGLFILIAIVR